MSVTASPTLGDVLVELRQLRAEVTELRQQANNATAPQARLVSAAALAAELGVSRQWVYQHRDELGAAALGTGPKPRLRFNVDTARRALDAADGATTTTQPKAATGRKRTRRQTTAGSILKVRHEAA